MYDLEIWGDMGRYGRRSVPPPSAALAGSEGRGRRGRRRSRRSRRRRRQ